MSKPGFYFYTGDWLKDTRGLSLEARGAWIDLLCVLHEAGGSITWPLQAFEHYWSTVERHGVLYSAQEIIDELFELNIADIVTDPNGKITVSCRRMCRDFKSKENNRKRQARFRGSSNSNARVTVKNSASSYSSSSSTSSSLKLKDKKESLTLPDWLAQESWQNFKEHRVKLHKPLTRHAEVLAIGRLEKFRAEGHDPAEIIDNAILNGWQGLFPPRSNVVNFRGERDAEPKGFKAIRKILAKN